MNRLGRYDVDAAFDRMSLQTVDEFGLDAILGLDGLLESVKEWYEYTGRVMPSVQRLTHGGAWPCFEWLLTVVNTGGSVRAWRAEQARELLFLKRLVKRARDRKRARAELTMTHRLFLLRDDALFLRCLEYCWFLDPWKRYPSETDYRRAFGAADTESES